MKRFILGVAAYVLLWGGAGQATEGGGAILPATARPSGYTLEDMAEELAYFSTSGNDLTYYPHTPFQILYTGPTNNFTAPAGTRFFVPILFIDDSPPVLGNFPMDSRRSRTMSSVSRRLGGDVLEKRSMVR